MNQLVERDYLHFSFLLVIKEYENKGIYYLMPSVMKIAIIGYIVP